MLYTGKTSLKHISINFLLNTNGKETLGAEYLSNVIAFTTTYHTCIPINKCQHSMRTCSGTFCSAATECQGPTLQKDQLASSEVFVQALKQITNKPSSTNPPYEDQSNSPTCSPKGLHYCEEPFLNPLQQSLPFEDRTNSSRLYIINRANLSRAPIPTVLHQRTLQQLLPSRNLTHPWSLRKPFSRRA